MIRIWPFLKALVEMLSLLSCSYFCSKDGTCGLRDAAVADDARVLFLDLRPEALCCALLHFDLDVVLSNLAFTEVELARIFDKYTCVGVFDDVVQDVRCGLAG